MREKGICWPTVCNFEQREAASLLSGVGRPGARGNRQLYSFNIAHTEVLVTSFDDIYRQYWLGIHIKRGRFSLKRRNTMAVFFLFFFSTDSRITSSFSTLDFFFFFLHVYIVLFCLVLLKRFFSLVHTGECWNKNKKKLWSEKSVQDPCLFCKDARNRTLFIALLTLKSDIRTNTQACQIHGVVTKTVKRH